jgi:hypothetical protein
MVFEAMVLGLLAIVGFFGIGSDRNRYHRGASKGLPRYL